MAEKGAVFMDIYVVKQGDSLGSIAETYGVSGELLAAQNGITGDRLAIGQTLVVQYPEKTYTVERGDTLEQAAEKNGVDVNALLRNNPQLGGSDTIYEGQTLVISYFQQKYGELAVNGYVYPFVELETLRKILPYSTYLTIFTYGFDADGNLVDKGIVYGDDAEGKIISLALSYGVAPLMHLSTLTPDGNFSSELANALLENETAQDRLIENVMDNMRRKNYFGIDVDFEYVEPRERKAYATFLGKMREAAEANGYFLVTALAPKTSSDMPGLLYEAHDYGAIGGNSDYVFLMTYEWGYTYGPPMAVSPINKMREVLSYALTEIAPGKIFLGIPNYAYDWTLPYIRGESKALKVSNSEAVDLAVSRGAEIQFDETAQTPYFYYSSEGKDHVVWFDDARSLERKISLAAENGSVGVGYWNFMYYYPQNWLVLNSLYDIKKVL